MHVQDANRLAAMALLITEEAEQAAGAATGLSERELAALVLVHARPDRSVDWLHQRLGITQSGTVRLVERLVASGLMSRARPRGRRQVALSITAAGVGELDRATRARTEAITGLTATLAPAERTPFIQTADALLRGGSRDRREADMTCRTCAWSACEPDCPVDASVPAEAGPERP